MLVTLLPFFLAARFPFDDDPYRQTRWQPYGAEATYDVMVNMSVTDVAPNHYGMCSTISSELRCRPKGSDTLVCQFANPRISRPTTNCASAGQMISTSDKFIEREPFEIRFNTRGIENLVVRRTIPRWKLDMIKAIVSQLNVGIESGDPRRRFNATESSNIGSCDVEVNVVQDLWNESADAEMRGSWEIPEYEIFVESMRHSAGVNSGRSLRIEKIRNPEKCPRGWIYFFGNHANYGGVNGSVRTEMVSSVSRMFITKQHFVSDTVSEGASRAAVNSRITRSYQKISLALKSIQPAHDPLPEVSNPASTGIHTYSHARRFPPNARRATGAYYAKSR